MGVNYRCSLALSLPAPLLIRCLSRHPACMRTSLSHLQAHSKNNLLRGMQPFAPYCQTVSTPLGIVSSPCPARIWTHDVAVGSCSSGLVCSNVTGSNLNCGVLPKPRKRSKQRRVVGETRRASSKLNRSPLSGYYQ